MVFEPRRWQEECLDRFQKKFKEGDEKDSGFVLEACMGSGKSAMAAMIAEYLLSEEGGFDHVLVLVPWQSIQGDVDKGMLGAFGELGLDARNRFFTLSRRQPQQPRPQMDATVTLYQEVCNQQALDTIRIWQKSGFKFAIICDEIHHTNEINSSWGNYVSQLVAIAGFAVFMSGTFFRSDKKPISCIRLDEKLCPIKDYAYPYREGVKDRVVRPVTTRNHDAVVKFYNRGSEEKYEVLLSEVKNDKELAEAKKQVLDPRGECIRHMIQTVHTDLLQTRIKFHDAACLFVCRPGGGGNYTQESNESQEDRHVHTIAQQIADLTGETPVVVTHRDKDAMGKIARFRRGIDPYLVAVNMVSEGCDIPRFRAVAFCRYTDSEMLFRQIVGRALRTHTYEDDTASQIYIPAFPCLIAFAERLHDEADEGIREWPQPSPRECPICHQYPCICPCPHCGEYPCVCPPAEKTILGLGAAPNLDGGNVGQEHVSEEYVLQAIWVKTKSLVHQHANNTQLGYALQIVDQRRMSEAQDARSRANPTADREKMRRRINRLVKQLAYALYKKDDGEVDYARSYYQEIEVPFKEKLSVILNTWSVTQLRQVEDRLESRIVEVFRG